MRTVDRPSSAPAQLMISSADPDQSDEGAYPRRHFPHRRKQPVIMTRTRRPYKQGQRERAWERKDVEGAGINDGSESDCHNHDHEHDHDYEVEFKPKACCRSKGVTRDCRYSFDRRRQFGDDGDRCDASSPSIHSIRSLRLLPHPQGPKSISTTSHFSLHSFFNMILLLTLALLQPCSAAIIPFENCLPESYKSDEPPPALQWIGRYVDATLHVLNETQNLKVTMWGNVTGSRTKSVLPPWNDTAYWSDDTKTEGKILRAPDAVKGVITTLHSDIKVLTYEPWNSNSDFCANLTGGHCPLGPVFKDNATRSDLPSVSLMNNFTTSYAFTSWSATFIIKYTDSDMLNIGCVSATITPDLGSLAILLKFLPVAILGFVGFATVFAAMFSPWGTTDIFHWTSNYGRDNDLLRLVTPGFGDCLQYIQFIALTGGLTLSYPGFYQPIVSQIAWSTLMFNETFVSKEPGFQSLQDGIYVASSPYGLQTLAQLTGMGNVADIWPGMMVWLLVIIAAVFTVGEIAFFFGWIFRKVKQEDKEDLRNKNMPFSVGNLVRIVFNYFLLPIVALSTFQLVVSNSSPAYTVALAVVTLVLIVGFASWLLYLITTKPRQFLFDDLPTVLLYGPLYNTYSDEAAAFTLVPIFLTFLRGIAVGAVQPSGIAQIILLAICELVQIATIHAFKPFQGPTSMNAYHSIFAALRLVSVLLMVVFIPALGITEGPRGWVGYAILVIHGCVLGFGFFLNALQTTLEVSVRLSGAGGDSVKGLTRGGLSKIFGMRQLQRREGPSRNSQLSSAGMLDQDEVSKSGYVMPSGRLRSESAGSGALLARAHRSSSALDNNSLDAATVTARNFDSGASSFAPTTPGEASTFSFLPSPSGQRRHPLAPPIGALDAADPYYRPPRRRGDTLDREAMTPPRERNRGSWASGDWSGKRFSQAGSVRLGEGAGDVEGPISRTHTPGPYSQPTVSFAPGADYSMRESDFYYGVRGQRLNSDAPSRKLGTGPADPTGTMASAAGWFRNMLGGKTKEKGKGFEVVRSSRMPAAMKARGGDITDDAAPQGIPVAMSMLRNGPIESDDEDDSKTRKRSRGPTHAKVGSGETELLDEEGNPKDDGPDDVDIPKISDKPPMLPGIEPAGSLHLPSRVQSKASRSGGKAPAPPPLNLDLLNEKDHDLPVPAIPRKSSRRDSGNMSSHSRDSSLGVGVGIGIGIPRKSSRRNSGATSSHSRDSSPGGALSRPHSHLADPPSTPGIGVAVSNNHPQPPPYPQQQQHQQHHHHQHSHPHSHPHHLAPSTAASSRLPFERHNSQRRLSSASSIVAAEDFNGQGSSGEDLRAGAQGDNSSAASNEERPTSYGYVHRRNISRVDPNHDLLERSAEVVDR